MSILIFIIVLAVACVLVSRQPFIRRSGLGIRLILFLFLFKVLIGVLQAYINNHYFPWSDTWGINAYSYIEYKIMLADPGRFFRELVVSNYNGSGYDNVFGSYGSFWNDLEANLLAKGLAPFNVISRGNYYINSILFNFFGFFGHIALFRVFQHLYPGKRNAILAGCFLLPSCMFFSSAIGKDNVSFTLLGLFCFALYFFSLSGLNIRRWLWLLFFFTGMLIMRNHIALLLLPASFAFYCSVRRPSRRWLMFAGVAGMLILLLWVVPALLPAINPAAIISQKQNDFLALGTASTQISLTPLEPTTAGLFKNLPEALIHGFFRPFITEIRSPFIVVQVAEVLLFVILLLLAVIRSVRYQMYRHIHPFILFCFFFCLLVFVMNGYIVPNTNTLARYRSIYMPLMLIPLLCNLQPNKVILK